MTIIETERLLLRQPRANDAAELAVAYADPKTVRYIGDGSTVGEWYERDVVMRGFNAMLYALQT